MKVIMLEKFHSDMGAVLPWQPLIALIETHYPKASKNSYLIPDDTQSEHRPEVLAHCLLSWPACTER